MTLQEKQLMVAILHKLQEYKSHNMSTWVFIDSFNGIAKQLNYDSAIQCYEQFIDCEGIYLSKKKDIAWLSPKLVRMTDKDFIFYITCYKSI